MDADELQCGEALLAHNSLLASLTDMLTTAVYSVSQFLSRVFGDEVSKHYFWSITCLHDPSRYRTRRRIDIFTAVYANREHTEAFVMLPEW
jgi:hypothetical protein